MKKELRLVIFLILSLLLVPISYAEINRQPSAKRQTLTVSKVIITGQKKIEESAIRSKLITQEGAAFKSENIRADVQAIFDTGYFYDVEVDQSIQGSETVLTYTLVEKPSIVSIEIGGNDELDDDEIRETIGLKEYQILNIPQIQEAVEKIEKLYEDKGFFLAKVSYKTQVDEQGNQASVIFEIIENDMVKVSEVRFLGNSQLSSGKLKSVIETKEDGFFSYIFGSEAYKQDAFDRDLQRLNFMYFNEGFIQVKIDRPQVYVSPDKRSIYIAIRINEGERFNIGSVDFTGDLLFPDEELETATKVKSGERFSSMTLQEDLRALQAKYGDLGYAYANIIPRTQVREKERLVDIIFEIDKGQKVYIGKINVKGNSKTRDKVLRRELKIYEGELYNETRKRESEANIKRLGFFDQVVFNTKTPEGKPDVMDIDIVVKERNTGTIQLGAGFSSYAGFVINGQINQINFLGRGQKLGASLDYSDKQVNFNINFTEPYLLDTEWSLGGDLYHRRRTLTDYKENKTGGSVRVGHPLAPYLTGILGYKLDDTELEPGNFDDDGTKTGEGDADLFPVDTANGITSALTASLVYDKRDDRFAPTDGIYSSLSLEFAGVGGDIQYTKGLASFRYYKKVFWDVVWRNNINYGVVTTAGDKEPPFNELFLLGGANSLRGFKWFTVGRRKYSQKAYAEGQSLGLTQAELDAYSMRPYGGTQQFYYNLEFQFPLIDEAGLKGVVFYDIGNADDVLDVRDFRSDVGFGFRWYSPIGPLRFEWGFPFDPRPEFDESKTNFNFTIGSPF